MNLSSIYNDAFYKAQRAGSYHCALVIMKNVCSIIQPSSVVDVGCGAGGWLRAAQLYSDCSILGVDGSACTSELYIPEENYRVVDFESDFTIDDSFDLAISLEVAEHISKSQSKYFIEQLTDSAPVVLFSAAVPNQGGINHINEQWQSYWMDLFERKNFVAHDCIRPLIYEDDSIPWWYSQNTFLYVSRSHPLSTTIPHKVTSRDPFVNLVHPRKVTQGRYNR